MSKKINKKSVVLKKGDEEKKVKGLLLRYSEWTGNGQEYYLE